MSRDRVLLVGEDFGNSLPEYHHDAYALTGASGRRLIALAGYQGPNAMLMYALDFARTNVVELAEDWRDKAEVAAGVRRIDALADDYTRVVLLGKKVAAAFGRADQEPFVFVDHWAVMPHPSGRNHWWNDWQNHARAKSFMFALRQSV